MRHPCHNVDGSLSGVDETVFPFPYNQGPETHFFGGHQSLRGRTKIHKANFAVSAPYFRHASFAVFFRVQLRPSRLLLVQSTHHQSVLQDIAGQFCQHVRFVDDG